VPDADDEFGPYWTLVRRTAWLLSNQPYGKDLIPGVQHAVVQAALYERHEFHRTDCLEYYKHITAEDYRRLLDDITAELLTEYPDAARRYIVTDAPMLGGTRRQNPHSGDEPGMGASGR